VLKLVAEAAEELTCAPGDRIASENEPAKGLYLIRSGTVRATREGVPTPVTFGTGQSLGQMSLLDGGPVSMTAEVMERTELILLRPQRLLEKLAGNHEAGFVLFRAVARSLASRLRLAVDAVTLAHERPGA